MDFLNPLTLTDFYKVGHREQYPKGTSLVYSNGTARKSRVSGNARTVHFGLQYYRIQYLQRYFNRRFFELPIDKVLARYKRRINNGIGPDVIKFDHIEALHNLGYLPVKILSLPEGSVVPVRVPSFVIFNTKPEFEHEFFWLTNFLESQLSSLIWKPSTSATTAMLYRINFEKYCKETGGIPELIQWQGHDFSYRGMSGTEDAAMSGAGHLLSFTGTDTIPAIDFLEEYYDVDSDDVLIGGSVPATEHSVMCMGGKDGEFETYKRLITEVVPSGIISVVSDTWDFWKVVTQWIPKLKAEILGRNGKVVIRPDSGDPVKIITGYFDHEVVKINEDQYAFPNNGTVTLISKAEKEGAIQCLWNIFGGTTNDLGYKTLDSHIGLIYGDSITLERQEAILSRLKAKKFTSSNVVLGIGSYTYEYVTRDTYGWAMKATFGVVNGEERNLFKDPATDLDKAKKSACGIINVLQDKDGEFYMVDQQPFENISKGCFVPVFENGNNLLTENLVTIRKRIDSYVKKQVG